MKFKTFYTLILAAICLMPLSGFGQNPARFSAEAKAETQSRAVMGNIGDVNQDGNVNVMDVTQLINIILGQSEAASVYSFLTADINGDGNTNVLDVTQLINIILGNGVSQEAFNAFVNRVFTSMQVAHWTTTGNTHQCFGISAYNLTAEVMGDDMIMAAQGSGWFYYDASYNVKSLFDRTTWRPYDLWNAYYTWIGNANYLIQIMPEAPVDNAQKNYLLGQAHALRAYSYFMLSQWFARTYKGHENEPCVPIFDGLFFDINKSTGAPRSTVAQIYAYILNDIAQAQSLLQGTTQQSPNHFSYATLLGIKARVALVMEDWATAEAAAEAAIAASGKRIASVGEFDGLNNVNAPNVMWGAVINEETPEQFLPFYAGLFGHMDTEAKYGAYGQYAPKHITRALYNKMADTDTRRAWWDTESSYTQNYDCGYVQRKMRFSNPDTCFGDYVWMRVEEMYLTAAEAECMQSKNSEATLHLLSLMSMRDPNYTCGKTGTSLGATTNVFTGSLREEIILQRRIELWGEAGRIFDIKRLHQGFVRTEEEGWPLNLCLSDRPTDNPENYMWVLTIPKVEFDANPNLNIETDQNPLEDE
ncbi:MAG: RagB/SusD family nutrient uptake outer membrane protein [Muribaculaceae bacterium]|nr:RagB/SusD family nutrient uptake outer membrane protein [Muribaculaceae bacterium]